MTESVEPLKERTPGRGQDVVLDAMSVVTRPEQSVIDRIGALVGWQLAKGESGNSDGLSWERNCGAPIGTDLGICGECFSDRDLAF
ncbi:hypothetical protein [Mycobacteroides abscessus]|uniref:hypothetical protein n=1 Tax=Mycobacteroides abscessus TaxID=36809 RepID=UPI001041F3E3|nr:hypothetical protein [Mycobacteroides abscessus]